MLKAMAEDSAITPWHRERFLLREIEGHIRRFAFANRLEARQINTELFRHYGKPRRSMRYGEPENLFTHIKSEYPLARPVRGTGIPRVPTQAQFVNSSEFDDSFMGAFEKLR
jgi:hypothetical protein